MVSFSSTASVGYPVLILCLFLFWEIIQKNNFKKTISYIIAISISLFSLSLFAGWLSMTFLASVMVFCFIFFLTDKKGFLPRLINIVTFLGIFFMLNKLIGNQMYSSDQFLGRADIFSIDLKDQPFTIRAWSGIETSGSVSKPISCFSWEFMSNFGFSLFLLPVIFIYLKNTRNKLALLFFLCAALTMPLPIFFTFKLNPVDFNRLFGFGNTMLILLITSGIYSIYSNFFKKKILIFTYLLLFTLSPFSGFIIGALFTPRIYLDIKFSDSVLGDLKHVSSFNDFLKWYKEINLSAYLKKYNFVNKYKTEIDFLRKNSKPGDVAISSIPGIPIYAGVYALIPSKLYGFKDLLYSEFDSIYPAVLSTLDLHLLNELNVKWIGYDDIAVKSLLPESKELLKNHKIFTAEYKNTVKQENNTELSYELYRVSDLSDLLKNTQE